MRSDRATITQRRVIDLPVFIRYGKRRFRGARACMLSAEGIELRVQALTLPLGTQVELELNHAGASWRLPAQVSHRASHGVGLSFQDPQPQLLAAL